MQSFRCISSSPQQAWSTQFKGHRAQDTWRLAGCHHRPLPFLGFQRSLVSTQWEKRGLLFACCLGTRINPFGTSQSQSGHISSGGSLEVVHEQMPIKSIPGTLFFKEQGVDSLGLCPVFPSFHYLCWYVISQVYHLVGTTVTPLLCRSEHPKIVVCGYTC